jgi:copper chaperone CopZ
MRNEGEVPLSTTTYSVTGMTCQHCVNSVTEELSQISGVSTVDVFLVPGGASSVQVTSEGELDRAEVRSAVEEAGYELAEQSGR